MRFKLNYPVWWPPHSCLFTCCLCVAGTKNVRICIIFFIGSNQNNRIRTRIIFKCFVICLNQIFVQLTVIEACRVVCLCRCFSSSLACTLVMIKNLRLACLPLKIDLCFTWSNVQKNSLNVIQLEKAPSNTCEEVVSLIVIFL